MSCHECGLYGRKGPAAHVALQDRVVVFDVLVFFPATEQSFATFVVEIYGSSGCCREMGGAELSAPDDADDEPVDEGP